MADIDCGNCDCSGCDGDCTDCGDCDCGDCGDCCGCGDDCCRCGEGDCDWCGHGCCFCLCPGPDLSTDGHAYHHDHHCNWCPLWTWLYCDDCCDTNSSRRHRGRDHYTTNNVHPEGVFAVNTDGNVTNGGNSAPDRGGIVSTSGGNMSLANGNVESMIAGSSVTDEVVTTQPPPAYVDVVGNEPSVVTSQPTHNNS